MKLGKVYHWSPSKNRENILREGLKIYNSTIEYENPVTGKMEIWKPPYLCTATDPWLALRYVLPMFDDADLPPLDLYCFDIIKSDDVIIRNDRTWEIIEVRLLNSVSVDRLKYLATRDQSFCPLRPPRI